MLEYESPEHWWADREAAYRERPDAEQALRAWQEQVDRELAGDQTYENQLHAQVSEGVPGAQDALNAELTRQAYWQEPPEPSGKDDPEEWRVFFREFEGRDMPLNAEYEARKHRIEAAAPPDVGRLAAEYFERNDPLQGLDPDELAAERTGITVEALRIFREGPWMAEEAAEEQGVSVEQFYASYGIDRNGRPIAAPRPERQAAVDSLPQPAPRVIQVEPSSAMQAFHAELGARAAQLGFTGDGPLMGTARASSAGRRGPSAGQRDSSRRGKGGA